MAHEAASSGLAGSLPGRVFLKARDEGRVGKRGLARRGRSQPRRPQRTAWAVPRTGRRREVLPITGHDGLRSGRRAC
jgi:hypothetical protein